MAAAVAARWRSSPAWTRGDRAQPRRALAAGRARILAAYRDWVAHRPKAKVLVLYDTMWESTAEMAGAIVAGAGSRA